MMWFVVTFLVYNNHQHENKVILMKSAPEKLLMVGQGGACQMDVRNFAKKCFVQHRRG